jgi:heptosyltransferase-1
MAARLIVRLGAMGDIIHCLPAAESLKRSYPGDRVAWLVAPRWAALLEGNPFIDQVIFFERQRLRGWFSLRHLQPEIAFDLQGLFVSGLAARAVRPARLLGFSAAVAREPLATLLYHDRVPVTGPHRVERNLQLLAAAGAKKLSEAAWIPPGQPEGDLPSGPFVLASPFAGWAGKQWPLQFYEQLGAMLNREGLQLVVNAPRERAPELHGLRSLHLHHSSIAGLIHATREAVAVIGVDSGPLHLAAALGKPGVALYGPTDPAQTGPFRSRMIVLRAHGVETSYKRHKRMHSSMAEIDVNQVAESLWTSLSQEQVTAARES